MISITRYSKYLYKELQRENDSRLLRSVFCKLLYLFLFTKVIFLGPVLKEFITYWPVEFSSIGHHVLYAPVKLAQSNLNAFLVVTLSIIGVALVVRVNYFTSALIFWLSFSLSRLTQPMSNGSDQVLNLFLFISIFLSERLFLLATLKVGQKIISNSAWLLCQLQLLLIYLLSGYDKLISKSWRSGDAIYAIINLETYSNPWFAMTLNKSIFMAIAWCVILFELSFPLLIGFKRFQVPILISGFLFHMGIIFFLNLPDFGIIMILSYILFIPYRKENKVAQPSSNGK